MAKHRGTRHRVDQLSDRHEPRRRSEPGAGPFQLRAASSRSSLSSIDLGQGMKSVTRQICAETLGVPVEDVYVDTADSDTGPHCMGSFASRGTHRVGNAVMAAAARGARRDDGGGRRGAGGQRRRPRVPTGAATSTSKARRTARSPPGDVAIAAQFKQGKTISGRGIFLVPLSEVDPETGEMSPATCYAHACLVAEVEVDDETGEVAMVRDEQRL